MSVEVAALIFTVLAFLLAVVVQLGAIKKGLIDRAVNETREREQMSHRVDFLEKGQRAMGEQLTKHIEQTHEALEAIRKEMPAAIANGVSRAIAQTIQMQQDLHRQFLEDLDARRASVAATAPEPRKRRTRSTT